MTKMTFEPLQLRNGEAARIGRIPQVSFEEFRRWAINSISLGGRRIASLFAMPEKDGRFPLFLVLADGKQGIFEVVKTLVGRRYPALSAECPAYHWFEREIAESFAIIPEQHPWCKPIRFHRSETAGMDVWGRHDREILPGVTEYFTMAGDAAHEVAVGPVHAGVIEPGHFRFQCMGEDVYSLEISLGYQHRGIEKLMRGMPGIKSLHYVETAAGDSSVANATNYSRIVEALCPRLTSNFAAERVRGIALELERIANHVGDLGALAGDVAFLPTASFCGRIRGEYLNMTAEIAGNRFGRGIVVPGGVKRTLEPVCAQKLIHWIERVYPDLRNALALMFDSPTVLDRLENTGCVSQEDARAIGMVGVAARASGLCRDSRHSFPVGIYRQSVPERADCGQGDVFARAEVRRREIIASHEWLLTQLHAIVESNPVVRTGEKIVLEPDSIAVSVTEAWRGECVHVALTGKNGEFLTYKIIDPSFHNWYGLALALRGEQISNFPICNKSFNLSYCGHDL